VCVGGNFTDFLQRRKESKKRKKRKKQKPDSSSRGYVSLLSKKGAKVRKSSKVELHGKGWGDEGVCYFMEREVEREFLVQDGG